jgi:hypothetical protein
MTFRILAVTAMMLVAWGRADRRVEDHEVPAGSQSADRVTVGYDMAEAGLRWIELVATGASSETLHEAFMREVAPTVGCQAIIRHWARFRDWDDEIFYGFILEALDRKTTDRPLVDENGHPTPLGHARRLWSAALRDPEQLRANLQTLQSADIRDAALEKARRYLPAEADVSNHFHVVLFGASNAFSVGSDNGFDLLQLKMHADGTIDVEHVIDLFAHEMHHSGLSSAMERHLGDTADDQRIMLPGVLVAEGLATYYITPPFPDLEEWRDSDDPAERELASDWDRHLASLPELYARAAADIELGLSGELETGDLVTRWLGGRQGPAYGLGVDMVQLIDTELGTAAAVDLARDPRHLLSTYNEAAARAREAGRDASLFDAELAERLESFDAAG